MGKLWKKVVLAVVFLFSFGIFAPCSVLADTVAPTEVDVDVQITVKDKTYDINASPARNLKADVEKVEVIPESSEYESLIREYNVKATYSGDVLFNAPTIGIVPMDNNNIDLSKVQITHDPVENGKYKFVVKKAAALPAKLKDNNAPVPNKKQEEEQIKDAEKAEDIVYKTLEFGKGKVPDFSWSGEGSQDPEDEGSVVLNDYVWEVFSTARSGWTGVRSGYYDDWFENVKKGLKNMKEAGITVQDVKMTEWEKLVLAITAIGYDPRDVTYNGENLVDIISNKKYIEKSHMYFTPQYAVLALNSYGYINSVPEDGNHIDKNYLNERIHAWAENVTKAKDVEGSDVLGNTVSDMWIMAFQPIASYYNPNAQSGDEYYDVKEAMDYAFNQISNAQTYMGSFWGGMPDDYNNAYTNAQVYMTLGMAKQGIFDRKYIKNGNSIVAGALQNFDLVNGKIKGGISSYEPAQVCRGLDSLVRAYEGRNSIFDCRDVENSTVPVNNAIKALPDVNTITSSDRAQVENAKASYDKLSGAKKDSISQANVAKLAAAEEKISGNAGDLQAIDITNLLPDASYKSGENATVSVKAENLSDSDKDVSLITALYDETGRFITYISGEQKVGAGKPSILSNMIKIPEEGIYKIKTFVWDRLDNMNPLSDVIDIPVSGK